MPGSHLFLLGERLVDRDVGPLSPMPPVDAALRAAGARREGSIDAASGARAIAWAVVSCNVSIALTGVAVLDGLALDVNEESSRSARFFDNDRAPRPRPEGGGGGKVGADTVFGESLKNEGGVGIGDRPVCCLD